MTHSSRKPFLTSLLLGIITFNFTLSFLFLARCAHAIKVKYDCCCYVCNSNPRTCVQGITSTCGDQQNIQQNIMCTDAKVDCPDTTKPDSDGYYHFCAKTDCPTP